MNNGKSVQSKSGFLVFWSHALKEAFSFGWVVFGVMANIIPTVVTLIHHRIPSLETIQWMRWASDNQAECQLSVAALCIISYLAYAPYRLYAKVDARIKALEAKRPEFLFQSDTSKVSPQISNKGDKRMPWVDFEFQFRNSGEGVAYNTKVTLYYCWVTNPAQIFKFGPIDSVGKTPRNEHFIFRFFASKPQNNLGNSTGVHPIWSPGDALAILVQIASQANGEDGEICNDTDWIYWSAARPRELFSPDTETVKVVRPYIETFKQSDKSPDTLTCQPFPGKFSTGEAK
jgi:hypothetical protein